MGGIGGPKKFFVSGKRLDKRTADEMRSLKITAGVIPNAQGSCRLELGDTYVIAAVYGPREVLPKHKALNDRAYLNCRYSMLSFATPDRNRPGPSRRSVEIGKVISSGLAPAIMLEKYPKTMINVEIEVTNANAGTRCAAITAAAVALADAGIEMRDLVAGIAVGKIENKVVLDLANVEDNFGQADVPLAVMPNTQEVTLLQMDGDLTKTEFKDAISIGIKACEKIAKVQRKALVDKYRGEKK